MPIGYLITVTLVAVCTLFALAPPLPRRSSGPNLSYWLGFLVNELPFIAFYYLLASTWLAFSQGDVHSPGSWATVGLAALTTVGLGVIAWRGLKARPSVEHALNEGLGPRWQSEINSAKADKLRRRLPFARILFAPFFVRRGDVERIANIRYGDAGRRNLLDVYRHRSHPTGGPVLIQLHGGGFVSGRKNRETRPLLYRLASQGWVCISANYRLSPVARFPDHLVDLKKVIAWVRQHGPEYGADPSVVFVAGSSAGAHLAALAALTPNDPTFQPGFEQADTSVTAAICLYGYYGSLGSTGRPVGRRSRSAALGVPSSPLDYLRPDAPPFFVTHGDQDTVVLVDDTRFFVERLRSTSSYPVVYAELPGAHHSFDLFHSIRFERVVDAIEAFTAWVRSTDTMLLIR